MNIVCDTNVLISGVLFNGPPREILRLSTQGVVLNFVSSDILEEAEKVLLRPKFSLSRKEVSGIMQLLRDSFEIVHPERRLAVVKSDPDDDRILEAASAARASYVVSGDRDLLDIGNWKSIRIVSPAQFMAELEGG